MALFIKNNLKEAHLLKKTIIKTNPSASPHQKKSKTLSFVFETCAEINFKNHSFDIEQFSFSPISLQISRLSFFFLKILIKK